MVISDVWAERIEAAVVALTEQVGVVAVRMGSIESRLNSVETRLDIIEEHLGDIGRRLGKVEIAVEDLKDEVSAGLSAIDKDAETIINHEQRIIRLEGAAITA